jgi:DNA-binding transcriptional ArsR family regulator
MGGIPMAALATTHSFDPKHMAELAEVFHLMGDPSRLGILMSVMEAPRAVGEIAAQTGHSLSLVSHHLRLLRARRLVRAERRGKQVYYSLDDAHVRSVLRDMAEHMREGAR